MNLAHFHTPLSISTTSIEPLHDKTRFLAGFDLPYIVLILKEKKSITIYTGSLWNITQNGRLSLFYLGINLPRLDTFIDFPSIVLTLKIINSNS